MALKFCSLSSGSSGNCYLAGSDTTYILIDAGISAKKITDSLAKLDMVPDDISGILVSHEHSDHIKGIDVLARRNGIPVYSNEKTAGELSALCKSWDSIDSMIFEDNVAFSIGDLIVKAFPVSHDAVATVGFSVEHGGSRICCATDTGCVNECILHEISEADLIVLEANHDEAILKMGKYPWFLKQRILSEFGHLSNESAGKAIVKSFTLNPKKKRFLLAHLSKENNFPEMAYQTVLNVLEDHSMFPGDVLKIDLLQRDRMSGVYVL